MKQQPWISLVVAYSRNRVIGKDNSLPWRLPADLAHFKRTTMGHPIIMGRKTWDSLGKALPGRRNIVVSRNQELNTPGAERFNSLNAALQACRDAPIAYVIGGAQLYDAVLPYAHEIIATEVHADFEGDTWFAALDPSQWQETQRQSHPAENGLAFDFVTYQRVAGTSPRPLDL